MPPTRRSVLRGLGLTAAVGGVSSLATRGFGFGRATTSATALVAGSLLELAAQIPGASVEAHGSVAVRRLVLDGLREPDVIAVADPRLLGGLVDRASLFASNAVVLAYHPNSSYAASLEDDWRSALLAEDLRLGRTDPKKDPLGYRTVMALRLAERRSGLEASSVLDDSRVFLETDLLNALEGGRLDAAFTYRNMAVGRDLPHVTLPAAIDFSDPARAATYRTVSVDLGGTKVHGTPIRYAAAPLTDEGTAWAERLVSGREQLQEAGFTVPTDYPRRDAPIGGSA